MAGIAVLGQNRAYAYFEKIGSVGGAEISGGEEQRGEDFQRRGFPCVQCSERLLQEQREAIRCSTDLHCFACGSAASFSSSARWLFASVASGASGANLR